LSNRYYRSRNRTRFYYQGPEVELKEETLPPKEELPSPFDPPRRRKGWYISSYARVRIAAVLVTLFAVALVFNLYHWQVERSNTLAENAKKLHLQTSEIPARRGLIYDTNGHLLASNTAVYLLWVAPRSLNDQQVEKYSDTILKIIPTLSRDKVKEALTYKGEGSSNWNLIATNVSAEQADEIREQKMEAIYLEAKARRYYPNNTMLSHLLGFTNYEMKGAYGIEGYYEKVLGGQPGKILAERDASGYPIALGAQQISPPVDGADLTLTVDTAIQSKVEREVLAAMFRWNATGAHAIVMNPQTGAILAWVSYPDYDPNEFYKTDTARFRDPNISEIYEPGSTFKIFTAAIGIDTGVVTPNTNAGTLPGCVPKYGYTICNYNMVGYDNQTVIKTMQKSSNVGAMWIAEKFGPQRYYQYMKNFGIGEPTGVDLSGEIGSLLRWQDSPGWSPLDFNMNSFGQAIGVTPLQLVTAVSAVANGGKLMKPYVVEKVTRDGKVENETKPLVARQVISPESSRTTTDILVEAVRGGETRLADVKGYRIAGKTGTAQIALPTGGYHPSLYIGSTIAYAPADNPQFVVLVRLDRIGTFGSNTAAPAVKNIVDFLLHYYSIPPTEPVPADASKP
jgi:cell division protein FtsI/penicillin-binding protein 2